MSTIDSSVDALMTPPDGFGRSAKLTLTTEVGMLTQQALQPYEKSNAETNRDVTLPNLRFHQRTQRVARHTQNSSLEEHIGEFSPQEYRQAAQGEAAIYTPLGQALHDAVFAPIEILAQLRKVSIQMEWASKRPGADSGNAENQQSLNELREKRKKGIAEAIDHCREINDNLQPILESIFSKDGSLGNEERAEITHIKTLAARAIAVVTAPAVIASAARAQE